MADDVTLGELTRNMGRLSGQIETLTGRLGELPDWQDVRRVEAGLDQRINAERQQRETAQASANLAIKALEDSRSYLVRWVMGSVGTAVVGAIVAAFAAGQA